MMNKLSGKSINVYTIYTISGTSSFTKIKQIINFLPEIKLYLRSAVSCLEVSFIFNNITNYTVDVI